MPGSLGLTVQSPPPPPKHILYRRALAPRVVVFYEAEDCSLLLWDLQNTKESKLKWSCLMLLLNDRHDMRKQTNKPMRQTKWNETDSKRTHMQCLEGEDMGREWTRQQGKPFCNFAVCLELNFLHFFVAKYDMDNWQTVHMKKKKKSQVNAKGHDHVCIATRHKMFNSPILYHHFYNIKSFTKGFKTRICQKTHFKYKPFIIVWLAKYCRWMMSKGLFTWKSTW